MSLLVTQSGLRPLSFSSKRPATPSLYDPLQRYIDDGYSITLTEAPNDLGGRLRRNCALTTPELPNNLVQKADDTSYPLLAHTMWTCYFAPDNPDLCSPNFSMCAVDEGHFLAKVEAIKALLVSQTSSRCRNELKRT